MTSVDQEVQDALRKTRAAVKKLRSSAEALSDAGGWWGDVDEFLRHRFDQVASEIRSQVAAIEGDLDESYPRRNRRP